MINICELRVGNIVLYTQDNDELPVLKIDGDKKTVCLDLLLGLNIELNEQDIAPIPLTPEWLERCGFEDDKHGRWTGPKFETDNTIQWFEIEEDDRQKGFYWLRGSEWVMGRPFQFFHQLQNLYHSLVGEELTIKEIQ